MLYMRMFEFSNGVMLHENGNATRFGGMQCDMILHAGMRNARLERTPSRGKEFCWGNDHNLLDPGNAVGDTQHNELCGEMTSHAVFWQ
jgi:hypothetical protein